MALWKLFCSFQVLVGAFCASTGTAASTASSCVEIVDTETRMTKTEQTRLWTQSQRNSNFSNRARRASETQRVRMSHGLHWFPISEFAQEIPRDLMNGLRENTLVGEGVLAETKCLRILILRVRPTRGSNLAGRQGFFAAVFRKHQQDNELPRITLDRNDLAFSDFSVGLRPFAPVFGFLRCNDTRNVTRRERLPSVSRRNAALVNSVASLR